MTVTVTLSQGCSRVIVQLFSTNPMTMQILLIGNDDSPPKRKISLFLDLHADIVRISITSKSAEGIDLDNIGCAIYVDRNPDQSIVDRLRSNNCPLILVADQDCSSSCLFIQFDKFAESAANDPILLIQAKLRSLYSPDIVKYQRNLFPLILTDEDKEIWERLKASEKQQNVNESTKYELTPEQELIALHYYEGSRDGLRDKEIIKELGKGRSSFYDALEGLRELFGVLDNPALALKLTTLVERGDLVFGRINTFSH
jgi:hypothetical protein